MGKRLPALLVVMLTASTGTAFARVNLENRGPLEAMQAPDKGEVGAGNASIGLKDVPSDTLDFGFYTTRPDGKKYAVLGETWTWDHWAVDPLEGWTSVDLTAQIGTFFRYMTAAIWAAEQNGLPAPAMNGTGFALVGTRKGYSDSLNWGAGGGYGNNFCQRLTSPTYTYDGSGSVDLSFYYFNQSEPNYDYTYVYVEAGASRYDVTQSTFTGPINIDGATGLITPGQFVAAIANSNFGGGSAERAFNIVVEFVSDSGWSDEDGGVDTWYGPFGLDDVSIGPANLIDPTNPPNPPAAEYTYDFETGLQGWIPGVCPGIGSFFGIADIGSGYNILDPCPCSLTGNVVKLHDGYQAHPDGQHVYLYTPIMDRQTDIDALKGVTDAYLAYNRVFAEYDQYADMPTTNGVFYRGGWAYSPYADPHVPGLSVWSPRVGNRTFYYAGGSPTCTAVRSIGTDWGLPVDTKQLKFIYELYASCDWFGVTNCSGLTNFSPLIDNLRVRNTGRVLAPAFTFATGDKFQDGFGQGTTGVLSTTDPGNADVTYDLHRLTANPSKLGDSLVIIGPVPVAGNTDTRWEAKLWFRLNRIGPGQTSIARYTTWQGAVAGAKGEFAGANANFAWGYMDSCETGTSTKTNQKYRFCSRFRDGAAVDPVPGAYPLIQDLNYNWGGTGEISWGNAILPDLCFTPGTRVQYFITSNYVKTPAAYEYLPDTTGKNYYEFEILPSYRTVSGIPKFPCTLYIDAHDGRGATYATQYFIEKGLNIRMNGLLATDPIPDPTVWDRYDYGDASSNWNASLFRQFGGTNGATIPQLLGYKLIMVNTGNLGAGCMESRDWQGFQSWLENSICQGNSSRQGFIANGNSISEIINTDYPSFLTRNLGATHTCGSQNEAGCPGTETVNDQNFCTTLGQVPGYFASGIPTDVWANWCPAKQSYGVLAPNSAHPTAVGNKYYEKIGAPGVIVDYAEVINDRLLATDKYRTVIDDFSYDRMIEPNPAAVEPLSANDCRYGTTAEATLARINAAANELENAITWTMGGIPGFCVDPCVDDLPGSVSDDASRAVTRLYQNHPNPFNPRTFVRFSLAADGPAKLVIYDVSGRRIRTLIDGSLMAGMHEVVWDGTDDTGHAVSSGVYWSHLQAGDFSSNRKMVVLK